MRILSFTYETTLEFSGPVTDHSFILRCLPRPTQAQTVLAADLYTVPRMSLSEQLDGFGNRFVAGRCVEEHTSFDFYVNGLVMVDQQALFERDAEWAHPAFSIPTAKTTASEAMRECGRASLERAGISQLDADASWDAACALTEAAYNSLSYAAGSTTVATTAAEAFAGGRGVCQDFAHVLIGLCCEAGIPARYANGLMLGEGETHAWVEVHDGKHWRGLDPTHNRPVDDNYILFSVGREFSDCPIERGVFMGNVTQTQHAKASVSVPASTEQPF